MVSIEGTTNTYAKAGVMFRGALTAGSANVILDMKPGGGIEFMARSSGGGSTSFIAGGTGSWLKLVRSGNTFTASMSSDGSTWTQVGTTSVTLPSSAWVGLAVCSHDTTVLNTSTFDNVVVPLPSSGGTDQAPTVAITSPTSGKFAAGSNITFTASASDPDTTANNTTTSNAVAVTVSATSGALPLPWMDQDIGAVAVPGSATYNNGTFTVQGAGSDIWGTADSFNFVGQPETGDRQIVAHVASIQNTSTYAKAGVMFRGGATAGSADVILDVKPGGGVEFMTRATNGGSTSFIAGGTGNWLKLARSSNTFTAYVSSDGSTWTPIGSVTVSLPASAWVGLAVCSHDATVLNTSMFDHVTVQ